jgi:hypothetical protein
MPTPQELGTTFREDGPTDAELANGAGRMIEQYLGTLSTFPEISHQIVAKYFSRNRHRRAQLPDSLLEFRRGDYNYSLIYNVDSRNEKLNMARQSGAIVDSVALHIKMKDGLPEWGGIGYRIWEVQETVYPENSSAAIEMARAFLEELKQAS